MAKPIFKPPTVLLEDIMVTKIYRVIPELTLFEVSELFIRHQISGAPVVDSLDNVISMIGEGDTLRLAAIHGLEAHISHCLPELPTQAALVTLAKHDTFTDAYRLFLKHKFHRLPIVDSNGRLQGLVTRSTILTLFVEAHYGKKIARPTG